MEEHSIIITDQTILAYYRENPQLDIVAMNHIFIDILKNLSSNLTNTINSTINSKILSVVTDIERSMSTFKSEVIANFNDRLMQTKKDYIEDLKLQLSNNFLSNNEKIALVMDKTTDTILTKTSTIINEIIPKSQDRNYAQIENCIRACCSNIEHDTKKLLDAKHTDENSSKTIIDNIENNFSKMISSIQTPIFSLIQSSEERTVSGIQSVRNEFIQQQVTQEKLTSELNEFLNKYKNNSSMKGNVSENELYFMLQSILPSDEIIHVGSEVATCDFRVNRKNKDNPTILFENKDYSRTVSTAEVTKFERDLQTQQHHGIFISQKTPITYKENFQIDIIKGLIHVYIPNANYDTGKLKIAIDIIDNLSEKLKFISGEKEEDVYETNKKELEELADEYHKFALEKDDIKETVQNMSKILIKKLEDMQLPKIEGILERFGILDSGLKCPECPFRGKSATGLSMHCKRWCKVTKNKKHDSEITTTEEFEEQETGDNVVEVGKSKSTSSKKGKGKKQKQKEETEEL
jgi:hypothetical protein